MKAMEQIKDMVCQELEDIARKGELSAGDLDVVHKLVVTKEKLLRIEELEQDLGYSEGQWSGESDTRGSYRGGSYSRRRDSRGRYSSRDKVMDMMDNGEFSYAQSQAIRSMMDETYGNR